MMKSAGRIVRKNRSRPFKDFHSEWLETLRSTIPPRPPPLHVLLRLPPRRPHRRLLCASPPPHPTSSPPSTSPTSTPPKISSPRSWTNLLRSFLDPSFHSPFPPFSIAFDSPSQDLISKIDQIERGLRLIVPAINKRLRERQCCFVENIAAEWASTSSKGKEDGSVTVSEEAIRSQLEELESVFGDANRLRRSILSEIVGAADVYQGVLFLEALAEFVLGFRDPDLLREFEQGKIPLSLESS